MQIRTLDRTLAILATLVALSVAMVFILSAVLFFSQAKPSAARSQ